MRIFKEGNKIRFQLVKRTQFGTKWLFDFSIQEGEYGELKKHMLEAFETFEKSENKDETLTILKSDLCKHDWSEMVYRMGGIWEHDPHWYRKCKKCGKGEELRDEL